MRATKHEWQRRLMHAVATGALLSAAPALSQTVPRQDYDLKAQDLADALRALSRVSGKEIMFPADAVRGRRAPALKGALTLQAAVDRLIGGTDLVAEFRADAVLIRGRSAPSGEQGDRSTDGADILVTGSRIKGAPPTSPVIVLSAQNIRDQGHNDLGEAIRSLPQNFSGGQNPGVTISAGGGSQNVTSGSSLNLRGLGADASLTLLNGHRIAYDSATQAIDISAIPLAAVDRIEIVADGSSALYGSDAVGGVANIILRKDFSGVDTLARVGTATDGGFVQQQYSAVAGAKWSSGGLIATAQFQKSTEIIARDRPYTAAVPFNATLYPAQNYVGAVLSGHQAISDLFTLDMDGYYSRRNAHQAAAYVAAGYLQSGSSANSHIEAIGISPRLSVDLASGWHGEVRGTYGRENVRLLTDYYVSGAIDTQYPTRYDNRLTVAEANVEGGLVRLPAGSVRLAVGGGYRSVGLLGLQQTVPAGGFAETGLSFDNTRNSYFAYGELFVPLLAPVQRVAGATRLSVTLAGRFEKYVGYDSVFTPKVGVIYSPTSAIDIKGSWGRSFKAPTLYQTSVIPEASLYKAAGYASGYPAAAGVLVADGGNPNLTPERATTWTATVAVHPTGFHGARLEISYFNIDYRDRILLPLGPRAGSLTNPIYQDIVTLSPTPAQIDSVIARSPLGLENFSGVPFAYSNVVGIIDNRYRNIARYRARGVDFTASVPIDLGSAGSVTAATSISYLESSQQTNPRSAIIQRAGNIFFPPHWRMRSTASWVLGRLTLTPAIDYIGDLADARTAAVKSVGSMTTFDLTAHYRLKGSGLFDGVDLSLSVLNGFNAKPAPITVPVFYYPAYDSPNYSAIGRSISATIEKRW